MKLLLDTCISRSAQAALKTAGHDVEAVADAGEDPGDDEILRRAHSQMRVLVTLDKDFGELAIVFRHAHSGIVRLVGISASEQGTVCAQLLARCEQELNAGAIVTVEPGRVRVRAREDR